MENVFRQINDLCHIAALFEDNPKLVLASIREPLITGYEPFLDAKVKSPVYVLGASCYDNKIQFVFIQWTISHCNKDGTMSVKDQEGNIRGRITTTGQAVFPDGYGVRGFYLAPLVSAHPIFSSKSLLKELSHD